MKLPAITEKKFMSQVLQLAKLYRWRVYHTFDSRRSAAGFPDLVLVRAWRVVFAELKSEKGKLSTEQVEWVRALEQAGVEIYVWRPSDWKAIEEKLA